ncbi:hypothetical protein UlMin_034505 [Ulmus minor]
MENPKTDARKTSGDGKEEAEASPAASSSSLTVLKNWTEDQDLLKRKLISEDDFAWKIPKPRSGSSGSWMEEEGEGEVLKYVGGVDISFSMEDPSVACGILVVLDLYNLQVVYQDFSIVTLNVPYVPGFLAFREVLMVDGNGVLHPRGFGLACHLGVLANLPTIGIGKNLHHVDGLTLSGVKELLKAKEHHDEDFVTLTGYSGRIWGVAMKSTGGSLKPIFVSTGHRISLDTAIKIVKLTCKYRVPEPIRQADIRSRDYLRRNQI